MPTPRLVTGRLVLTWPTDAQVRDYAHAIQGSSLFDTIVWDGLDDPEELVAAWARRTGAANEPLAAFKVAAIDPNTGRYLGDCTLCPTGGDPRIRELGYAFNPWVHGRGYATEAVRAVVEHGFGVPCRGQPAQLANPTSDGSSKPGTNSKCSRWRSSSGGGRLFVRVLPYPAGVAWIPGLRR